MSTSAAADAHSAPTCPMAALCHGTVEKPNSAYLLLVPGVLLILIGVAIVVEPRILVWLIGGVLILLGIAIVLGGCALRRVAVKIREQQA